MLEKLLDLELLMLKLFNMSKKTSSAANQQGSLRDPSETIRRAPSKFAQRSYASFRPSSRNCGTRWMKI